jgi:hypothetical protein
MNICPVRNEDGKWLAARNEAISCYATRQYVFFRTRANIIRKSTEIHLINTSWVAPRHFQGMDGLHISVAKICDGEDRIEHIEDDSYYMAKKNT